jgi:hypothetical protein
MTKCSYCDLPATHVALLRGGEIAHGCEEHKSVAWVYAQSGNTGKKAELREIEKTDT